MFLSLSLVHSLVHIANHTVHPKVVDIPVSVYTRKKRTLKVVKLLVKIFYLDTVITTLTTTMSGGIAATNNIKHNNVVFRNVKYDNVVFCNVEYNNVVFCLRKHPTNSIMRLRTKVNTLYGVLNNVSADCGDDIQELDDLNNTTCLQHCCHNNECKDIHGYISSTFQIQADSKNVQQIINYLGFVHIVGGIHKCVGFQADSKHIQCIVNYLGFVHIFGGIHKYVGLVHIFELFSNTWNISLSLLVPKIFGQAKWMLHLWDSIIFYPVRPPLFSTM